MKKNNSEILAPSQEKIISVVNRVVLDKWDEFSREDMEHVLTFLEDSKISASDIYPLLMKSKIWPALSSPLMDLELKDWWKTYSPKILWQNQETWEYKDLSWFKDKLVLIEAIKEKINEQNWIVDDTIMQIENFSWKKPLKKIILWVVVFSAIIWWILKFSWDSDSEWKNFLPDEWNNSGKILEKKDAKKIIYEPKEVVKQIVEQNVSKVVKVEDKNLDKNITLSEENLTIKEDLKNIPEQFKKIVENLDWDKNLEENTKFSDNNLENYWWNLQKLKEKFLEIYSKNNEKILDTSLDLKTEKFKNEFNEIFNHVIDNIDNFSDERIKEIYLKNDMSIYEDRLEILNTLFPWENLQESYEKHYKFIVWLVSFKWKNVTLKMVSWSLLKYIKLLKNNLENK